MRESFVGDLQIKKSVFCLINYVLQVILKYMVILD